MMVVVVVNDAILLVEFANRRRNEGLSASDAAASAAQIRLRPILMTSLTLIDSMLPLSFQLAPGNEAMLPLARALLGGMLLSTILTLILVQAFTPSFIAKRNLRSEYCQQFFLGLRCVNQNVNAFSTRNDAALRVAIKDSRRRHNGCLQSLCGWINIFSA